MNATTAILAGGEIPSHEVPLRLLRRADRLIACDGAWRAALALGRAPDAVVGDGDSLGAEDRRELERRGIPLMLEEEQETNDLCKAFRHAVQTGAKEIVIVGATGRREDHAIGNIFHLLDFAEDCPCVRMVTDFGVFEPVLPPGGEWPAEEGDAISIFAPFPQTEIISEGLEWPLKGVSLDKLWRGTLNRVVSCQFSLKTNRPALIYRPHAIGSVPLQKGGGYGTLSRVGIKGI